MQRLPRLALVALLCFHGGPHVAAHPWRTQSPCRTQPFEGSRFTVCNDTDREMNIEVYSTDRRGNPLRSFDDFERAYPDEARYVRFGMNAGMFDNQGQPVGLLIQRGKLKHSVNRKSGRGNFYLMPNGILLVDGDSWKIVPTTQFKSIDGIVEATQSGPMLVMDGKLHPAFQADGKSRHIRNGVGIGPDGQPIFVITESPVSFGKFARFFRDEVHARNALYLDGSVSSLWDPQNGRRDQKGPIGPMVIAFEFPE